MRITHYLYNAFLVEEGDKKVAIDPGQYFYIFDFRSLIPEEEWPTVSHIVITHGDLDHHWQSDRVAEASGAPVVCGVGLTKADNGQTVVIDPRGKKLTPWVPFDNLHPLNAFATVMLSTGGIRPASKHKERFKFGGGCRPVPVIRSVQYTRAEDNP